MGKMVLISMLAIFGFKSQGSSQTVVQLGEQLALDYEKLSELKGILQDMYKAYNDIDKGLTDVKSVVSGNFNLHKLYLDGLLAVSPTVKNYTRVGDIVNAEYTLISESAAGLNNFKRSKSFSGDEINYIGGIYSNLLEKSGVYVDELSKLTTSNELRMGDAERLAGIDRVYNGLMEELAFLRRFNDATSIQDVQRAKEDADLGVLKSLY